MSGGHSEFVSRKIFSLYNLCFAKMGSTHCCDCCVHARSVSSQLASSPQVPIILSTIILKFHLSHVVLLSIIISPDLPRASRRRCNRQRSQGSEAGSSLASLTPGEVSPIWQSRQFYILALPLVTVILRQRVPLWEEAAPLLVESPPEDFHGPT